MLFTEKVKKAFKKELKKMFFEEIDNLREELENKIDTKILQNSEYEKQANLLAISDKVEDYSLHGYSDKKLRKKHMDEIKHIYGRKCAICGNTEDKELTLDHYFIPRSQGGMLIMKDRHTKAIYSNCVILCQACNLSKSAMSVNEFVTNKKKRLSIAEMNVKLTEYFRKKLGSKL